MDALLAFWPALAAGLLVSATHVPLGTQVLVRGIVFIDLAVAQIAGLGIVAAAWAGLEPQGMAVQAAAFCAALAGALVFTWTERLWPDVQEAIIGVVFVVAASVSILLLASSAQGAEHLKDMLAGQILWVRPAGLAFPLALTAAILGFWFATRERFGRTGFYLVFACAVTVSVQLVGLYLVFATLIVPALATRHLRKRRLALCYVITTAAYITGLLLSAWSDLPPGPLIACAMVVLGLPPFWMGRRIAA